MLPLFQIITTTSPSKEMPINDVPSKARRKRIDVPVHKSYQTHKGERKKSFSANFNSHKDKYRNKEEEVGNQPIHTEVIVEIPETDRSSKVSKKQLTKENIRLSNENKELLAKFNELEDLSVKKITKLREKIGSLQLTNAEIEKENCYLKQQHQDLIYSYENLQRVLENSKVCKNCEELSTVLDKYSAENAALKNNNRELTEDLNMLKTVVYRLNIQLERYQETLRRSNVKTFKAVPALTNEKGDGFELEEDPGKVILSEVHQNHRHTPVSWGSVNAHTLGPLLDAYEDRIKEKDEIIQSYDQELSNFTGTLKEVMEENETLHVRLTQDEGCSSKLKVELANLRQELRSVKEQNDLLIKKCAIKQDKVEEVLKVYEAKVSQMDRDFNVLHEEYIKCRTENAALKEKSKSLTDVQEDFRNQMQSYIPLSVHNSSVNECKKWYEELKQQYETEKQKMKGNIESQAKTINDINSELTKLQYVKEGLEAKLAQQEKHIKKWESKCLELEHALNEVQLSRSALRKQLHKVMGFAKDMVAEQETLLKALNQRHLENRAVKKIGTDMATKMDSLKNQLKDVQKNAWQEFTTVEQKIQEQADLIELMKDEHQKEIEKLQKVIEEQQGANLLLKTENLPMPHYLLFKDKYK